MKRCAWHECNRAFTPGHHRQKFCSPECQKARGAWKARRGGPLVDLLLADNKKALEEAKRRIKEEMTCNCPR